MLSLSVAGGVSTAGAETTQEDSEARYSNPAYLAAAAGANIAAQGESAALATPAERQERAASESAFEGLSPTESWSVAANAFEEMLRAPIEGGLRLAPGEHLQKYLGDHFAQVTLPGGQGTGVVQSVMPLRAEDESGQDKPVDLDLVDGGDHLESANPLAPAEFGDHATDGTHFPESGVTVSPEGANSAARQHGERVFYPEIQDNVDFVSMPVPTGAESSWIIRSAGSAESFELDLDLPTGAHLGYAPDLPGQALAGPFNLRRAIQIVGADGTLLSEVKPPHAIDADGRQVTATMAIDGTDGITVRAAHKDQDLKYPVLLDPVVEDFMRWTSTGSGTGAHSYDPNLGFGTAGPDGQGGAGINGWTYASGGASGSVAGCGPAWKPCAPGMFFGKGLYMWGAAYNYYSWSRYHEWYLKAPGDSYIYRGDFGWVHHWPGGTTPSTSAALVEGIWNPNVNQWQNSWVQAPEQPGGFQAPFVTQQTKSELFLTHCVGTNPCSWGTASNPVSPPGNMMVVAQTFPVGAQMGANAPVTYMGGAQLSLHEWNAPVIDQPLVQDNPLPSGWVDSHALSTRVRAKDAGLGATIAYIKSTGQPTWSGPTGTNTCTGSRASGTSGSPCPLTIDKTLTYNTSGMPEGNQTVQARAADIVGNDGPIGSAWQMKIDHSAPQTLDLTGNLYDDRTISSDEGDDVGYITQDETVAVAAADGTTADKRSGLASIEMLVDGNRVEPAHLQTYDCSSECPSSGQITFTLHRAGLSAGPHDIKVIARDRLAQATDNAPGAHVSVKSFSVYLGDPAVPDADTMATPGAPPPDVNPTHPGGGDAAVPGDPEIDLTPQQRTQATNIVQSNASTPFTDLNRVLGASSWQQKHLGPITMEGSDEVIGAAMIIDLTQPHAVDREVPSFTPDLVNGLLELLLYRVHMTSSLLNDLEIDVDLTNNTILSISPGPRSDTSLWDVVGSILLPPPPDTGD